MPSSRVLISYSRDSSTHCERVLRLAQQLRGDGVDAWIDQFEPAPKQGWPRWMRDEIAKAKFVVLVCSATYRRRFEGHEQADEGRGVTWEGMLLEQLRYEGRLDHETLVPVYFEGSVDEIIPTVVRGATNHALMAEYPRLVKRLTRTLAVAPAPLGVPARTPQSGGMPDLPSEDDRLIALRSRREQIMIAGGDTAEVETAILEARRENRDGPNLAVEDVLAGRYRLVERAGQGGFASVWKAYDRSSGRFVAVKILHGQWSEDRSRIARFMSGAQKMKSLHHPAIVPVIDGVGKAGHHHYFVMPWFSGGDLRQAMTRASLTRERALGALAQALEGLMHAHRNGLVHRDVKPDNILIDEHAAGWISDFDLVRAKDSTQGTRTGMGMGSFCYAASELMTDAGDADPRADVYGAGMCALFVLMGRDPPAFVLSTQPSVLDQLECSPRLREAIRGAIAYHRDQRTTTCAQLATAILDFVRGVISPSERHNEPLVVLPDVGEPRPAWAHAVGVDPYGPWATFRVGEVEQRMRWIAAGRFMMGSPESDEERFEDEGPEHEVTFTQGFWLADTPCTQGLWVAVMRDNPSRLQESSRLPVEQVSWDEVQAFMKVLNARIEGLNATLPTEAQWEYACRAGTKESRYGPLDEVAWHIGNSDRRPREVAQKRANAWGLHDMLGNVWEWGADARYAYEARALVDPPAREHGPRRSYRGGSWSSDAQRVRAAFRYWNGPGHRYEGLGFRLAASPRAGPRAGE